jgi:nicotinamidase-related amidase
MPLVAASESALVVVDTQPGFTDHAVMSEEAREIASAVVDRIAWLVGFAGQLGVPVVAVEEDPGKNGSTEPRVAARFPPDTAVESKNTFSLVPCERAVQAIRDTKRQTLVVVGFETDVCVAQSAIELCDLGFRVVVPADMVYTTSEGEHRHGLERLTAAGAEPSNFKGLIFEWLRTIARAEQYYAEAEKRFGKPPLRPSAQPG